MIKKFIKASARNQIKIKEVKEGILVLSGNKYRVVLATSAINFELKSEAEQDQIIDTFRNFLNSLPCPVQILIRTREVDIEGYLEEFMLKNNHETDRVYKERQKEYGQFIRKLVSNNKILSRKFYIVISMDKDEGKPNFDMAREQLKLNQDIVSKGMERMGMKTRRLGNLEILDLFYSFYNPAKAKTQPLTKTVEAFYHHANIL